MAWTAADINRISQGTNSRKKQWTAEAVQKVSKGTNNAQQATQPAAAEKTLYETAFDEYRANNNLGFADDVDSRRDWLNQQDMGTKDIYKDVNRWKDTDDNRNLSEAVKRIDGTHGAYTDADLIKNSNWTQADIDRARAINQQYETLPLAYRAGWRLGNSAKSLAANVSGAAAMAAGALPQAVGTEVKDDDPTRTLMRAIQRVDGTHGMYTDKDLVSAGWTEEQIKDARTRLAAGEASSKVDNPVYNWGKETHRKGEELLADAQAGESGVQRFLHSAAMSAGENLALGAVNPALVLPVLSLQGAGDSLAASDAKGESPEKAMAKAALKFGAGWAINSVGAADLAKTMGSDYAKNTVAGQIADWVRGMAGSSDFAQSYPAIANAVTGGIDNAMQAFVESYADQAIDAALGDADAAKDLFTKEHLLNALESGLSGGVSGAMGGAAGTGVGVVKAKAKQALETRAQSAQEAAAEKARQQRVEEPTLSGASRQLSQGESYWQDRKAVLNEQSPTMHKSEGSATEGSVEEQTTVNDDPAVHTWQDSATDDGSAETAVISDNLAVQTFAEAAASDSLTGKTIKLFTPEAGNEANRAAFTEVYGVELPDTAAATRRVLREVAAQRGQQNAVENAGERVETPSVTFGDSSLREGALEERAGTAAEGKEYADVDLKVDPAGLDAADEGSRQMRETYGLREPSGQTARQSEVQRQLEQWGVESGKTKAAQDISQKLPANVDADRYAAAASTIYHLAQMDEVKSFDDALRLAGVMDNTALNVNYILDSGEGGRIALNTAYLYGADTKEQAGGYGGGLTDQSASGQGRVYYKGTLDHDGTDMGSRIIELNAAATGTDAVLKNVLQNDPNVRAYVDNETARIFFGDNVSDIFGTVLHEDYHWYNSLDQAGAKSLQDHALTYLAQMDGYESVDEMIRDKMDVYASQKLTYEQAAEELVADAWRGIFATEADFKRWVEFQRGQAEKNAGVRGSIHKVMDRVKELLSDIISRAKEVLTIDTGNAAALKAKRLAEAQRRTLQDEYFAHAEKAMDTLRAAKENAAALKTESAAEQQGVRYSLPDMAKETEAEKTKRQMALTIHPAQTNAERTARVSETNWSGQNTQDARKALQRILKEFGIIGKTYTEKTLEIEYEYRTKTVRESANHQAQLTGREYGDMALVHANIEEVLDAAVPLEAHADKKGKPHVEGMIVLASALQDGARIIPVRAELKLYDNEPTALYLAIAETQDKQKRTGSQMEESTQKDTRQPSTGSSDRTGSQDDGSASAEVHPTGSSDLTITDFYNLVKHDANFAKYFSDEVAYKAEGLDTLQKESKALEQQRRELKEERASWMDSDEVKAIEAKKKGYGIFSAAGKAYRESAEYQNYLAKRKEFNQRGAELDDRVGEVTERIREANAQLEARRQAVQKDKQLAYNAAAEKAGGAAEYHRQMAKEKFGTTGAFEKAGYILPDGEMLNFAQNEAVRDTDHREIMDVFGPTDVTEGTDALNKFLAEGNIRVMAEQPGIDLSASVEPTAQQLEQIREMAKTLGTEKRQFTLDFSTKDGGIAATKDYSGRIDADKIVREIRAYYKTGELPAESSLARFRYQLNEQAAQADRDAKRNRQRQASRAIADNSAAIQTLVEMMGLTRGVRVSDDSILGVAERLVKASGAKGKADTERVAREMRTLIEYMKTEGADMNKAQGLAETIAGEILDSATYRNTELWQQYPEYHELSYTVDKNGKAKAELVRQYGSWGEAVAEARKHGVKLRQEEGRRDGNPAEEYEAIVNDTRSMGGTKQGAAELFRGAAKAAGVDGAASMESTEWLDVLMNVHDTIKPKMMSRFADVAEYEDAKVELAGRMIGDLLHVNEMNDAQAIFDSFQKWQRRAAAAAAGDETSAAKAVKDLRAVQKEQTREFNRRLAENQKAGNQSEAVQQMQEQQRRNAKAEAMLDANLDALGVDITNSGDMAEKLDVLKEAYEREWRAEKKRLKEERQQMLDEITLENKTLKAENRDLARQVANEQRRADRAEYSQIVQEREIMEWEAENQRKADAWQQKQAQKNAIAMELAIKQRDEEIAVAKEKMRKRQELASLKDQQERAEWYQEHSERFAIEREALRQQRDEDIAVAKALAEKRVQKARDGRKADELKRSIRNNAAQLNQMILRPTKGKYVQPRLIQQAAEVAKLADMAVLNDAAVRKLTALANTISQTQGTASDPSSLAYDWEQTGVPKLIQALQADMMNAKQAKLDLLHQQLTEAVALGYGEEAERLRDRLKARIKETENRTYLPMTVDQLRMLKAITAGTLHVIRTENKTLSLAKTEEVDAFAQKAGLEVLAAKGNEAGRLRDLATKYNLDMLGAKRVFRMLSGYAKNSQMERLADMLNDGQRRQTEIIVEGTRLFDNVTGKANIKQMERFAGPGAELVDIGLKDKNGKAVPLTHGQLCSLYMHLQNADSREHLLNGGLTLPDTTLYNKGDIERAYQKGQTVKIGMLTGADGMPMADTILNTVENALTDYDRKWIEDMKGFFGDYTTNLINETSMKLVGFQRATVKNYYPIAVDKTQLASEIEGVKMDATIEGRGFLKERVKSGLPILLEECSNVVQRSLRDTAAYAGLAASIRDANRILNANVETEDGIQKLKSGVLKEHWGRDAVNYVDYLLTDLQTKQRKRSDGIGRVMGKLRGNYAGAILTLNPGVAIAQAASLPTAGAVLGSDTMAAVLPFVKNLSSKQLAALKAEISEHGDALLQYRLRGSQRGELASIGVSGSFAEKAMDKLPKSLTGWINKMDEITVAALWEGAKHYVEHHTAEFADGAATKGSDAYWKAVNRMYQKVIEETQPNYTVMQRAGIQRSDNEITKTLTMFTTQRFQNYGILADAVMDYNAQKARYKAEKSAENKAEVQRAGQSLRRAAVSQVVQTAVFALMKIGADFLLHRWDREQDENGDVTAESLWNRFAGLFTESAAGNFLFGSEIYSMVGNAVNGTDYDVVSATNISAVNDLFAATTKLYTLIRKDTTGMDEEELEAYHRKLRKAGVDVMEYGLDIAGIPAANGRKMVEAFAAYADDVQGLANGEGFSLNGTPASATGQYDRLFNAIERGDAEEAKAARDKLAQMGKSDKVSSELKKRLKNYDPDIETAAKARNAGNDRTRQNATIHCIRELYAGLGIREGVKEDATKREAIIDLVTSAVDQKADALLAGDKDRNVYDDLTDALETGRAKDVQSEVDRLLTAGKKADAIQTKITGVVKSEYLAGNSHDREKLAAMLLRLEADGKPLYEEKDFESWVKQDKKKQEAAAGAVDEWTAVR
nr:MAG TPA: Chromosome segregation ATPase [Siphoviridae sp. cttZS1]